MTNLARHGRELVRRGLLLTSDAVRPFTAGARLEPTFLIVGGQRCGTTSMFKTLAQHPDVARPFLRKGIHYFDKNYDRSWTWYQSHFPLSVTSSMRRRGRSVHTGESSPYYMFHPHAAGRIARDLPSAKLIMLVRDPVERAYSAHAHELARGFDSLSFEKAISAEPSRLEEHEQRMRLEPSHDSHVFQHNAYLARGRYIEQIEHIVALVGRDRLQLVDSGDFFSDPAPTFARVEEFLGLSHAGNISFEKHNARRRSSMAEDLRARLTDYYEPWDELLAQWWGRTPSWRR